MTRTSMRVPAETKHSTKTTELAAYVAAVVAVLIAGLIADGRGGVSAHDAWLFVVILTVGYMMSRGLAKAGSSTPSSWDGDARDEGERFDRS